MPRLHERSFHRRKIEGRRGVWTTWGSPETWSSCLLRTEQDKDLVDNLLDCECVESVRDATDAVLAGQFTPPVGHWSLLVQTPYQPWATFADNLRYNAALESLRKQFSGQVLTTGATDDVGTFYVRLWQQGEKELELVTDGKGWPMPEEDFDEEDHRSVYQFFSRQHGDDWPYSFDRCEAAHQQIVIDLDAYIPHFRFMDNQLICAYAHRDAVDSKNITSVSVVQFA